MRRIVSVILVLATIFSLVGCSKNNTNNNISSGVESNTTNSTDDLVENNTTTLLKIDSLDKLNFYAVKKAISEHDALNADLITATDENDENSGVSLSNNNVTKIDPNSEFVITMYSYFTIMLNDANGFLAQKLGGTGKVEVVITKNNFNNMITFKKGERYYSCFQTSISKDQMVFSTHKCVRGFSLVENYDQENYQYTASFDGDRVIGISCVRVDGGSNYKYTVDDIKFNDNFSVVIYKKRSFTAAQLDEMFEDNTPSVDDSTVPDEDLILFKEASVTSNTVLFKNGSNTTVLSNSDIKTVSAMYNEELGYFIKLTLNSEIEISDKIRVIFYNNGIKDRNLNLQIDGKTAYITLIENQSRMYDVYYKLTADDAKNQIGLILDYDDFEREISKRLNLDDYNISEDIEVDGAFVDGEYTLNFNTDKMLSNIESNREVTIDGVTITMPVKVSELLSKGFTVTNKTFSNATLHGGATFITPKGNEVEAYILDFYGDSTDFNSCYVTQIGFLCYERSNVYIEGISPTRPDFEMLEGINVDSTLDDIISRLGAPDQFRIYTIHNTITGYKDCSMYIDYYIENPFSKKGYLIFGIEANGNYTDATPPSFITLADMMLH